MSEETKCCPLCGETIKAQAQKCRFCGQWLNEVNTDQQTEVSETKQCPYCGETIKALAKKCRFCGQWLNEVETKKSSETPKTKQCPYCGEEILFVAKKCKHCGEMLDNEARHEVRCGTSTAKRFDKDPIKETFTFPNWIMIFSSILLWGIVQPAWLAYCKKNKKHSYEYLNKVAENGEYAIPTQIPYVFAIVNGLVLFVLLRINFNWIWLYYINALALSIIEISYARTLEHHVQRQYGVHININRFLLFFLQSLYFNYVLLTYEKRISDAKQYRR